MAMSPRYEGKPRSEWRWCATLLVMFARRDGLTQLVGPWCVRDLRPMMWAGRLEEIMATRKTHSPEQVVRKLAATADRLLSEGNDVAAVCRELC